MPFLVKLVIFVLLLSFVIYVLKMIARLGHNLRKTVKDMQQVRDQLSGRPPVSAEMVRCLSCGAFVATRDAVTISARRNNAQTFCSQECLHTHVKSA